MGSFDWKTVARRAGRMAAGLLVVYVIFLAGMFWAMRQPPARFGKIMSHFPMAAMVAVPFEPMWNVARGGALRVGDAAPDFSLPRADHTAEVTLSAFRGKQPVVLFFGSYT
jgi:AhpC/TSA family